MNQAKPGIPNGSPPQPRISNNGINFQQFKDSLAAAKRHFSLIRKKYPDLKAYLVLSLPVGQTQTTSSPKETLRGFPATMVDGEAKTDMLRFLKIPESKDTPESEKERLKEQFQELAGKLEFDGKCQIEIRFIDLDYDLVWKLQLDDLVDRELTPQTKASIRIVLGTISRFAGYTNSSNPPK